MAAIPGLEGFGFAGFDFAAIGQKLLLGAEIGAGMIVMFVVIYFFILKPRKYKDIIEVIDPATKIKTLDKGYLKKNRDGTQDYVLRKNKDAKMETPPVSQFLSPKGKNIRQVIKYGPGDFNWAGGKEHWDFINAQVSAYEVINLTDQNWNKDKIRKEAEKKNAVSGIKAFVPQIMVGAVIVMFIISAWFITGVMKEGIGSAQSTISKSADIAEQNAETAKLLADIAGKPVGGNAPPPLT